jgi:hypothetical protein
MASDSLWGTRRVGVLLQDQCERISQAAIERKIARGWTHPLYRYPASMSPHIARGVIGELSRPGDTILDPFCGGGTTAIEAVAQGRRSVCSDLNSLACFITGSKAFPLSDSQLAGARSWAESAANEIERHAAVNHVPIVTSDGRPHVPYSYGVLLAIRDLAATIDDDKTREFAKLMILRTGQICFDSRQKPLAKGSVTKVFRSVVGEAIPKMSEYSSQARRWMLSLGKESPLSVIQTPAEDLATAAQDQLSKISLMLTSPPYPGIHVLYHRWQFKGRREVALPYQLLGLRDGSFESHYTLGSREDAGNRTYFSRIGDIFSQLNSSLRPGTPVVQVVAFSHPEWQLERYAGEMRNAGLKELDMPHAESTISRAVPNRKWYVRTAVEAPTRREYLLVYETTSRRGG